MVRLRAVLMAATMLAAITAVTTALPARAAPPATVVDASVPPLGIGADAAQRILERANPANST